jgi:hypothetical protein
MSEVPEPVEPNAIANYYHSHSTAAEMDDLVGVQPAPRERQTVTSSMRLDRDTMARLRSAADRHGVGVTQLMRVWVLQRLAEDEAAAGSDDLSRLVREVTSRLPALLAEATRDVRRAG